MSRILAKKGLPVGLSGPNRLILKRFQMIYLDQDAMTQYRNVPPQIGENLSFGARPMMPPPT
jgi:hypothetical protein